MWQPMKKCQENSLVFKNLFGTCLFWQYRLFMTQLQNTEEWWVTAGCPPALCNESVLQETNMKLNLSKHGVSRLDQSPLYRVPVCQSATVVHACLLFLPQFCTDSPFISYVNVPVILASMIIKKILHLTGHTTLERL